MPLEKYFLMSIKDILAIPFKVNIKGTESLSLESPIIYVTFMTIIDREKYPVFLGFSANCLNKLHMKMKLTKIEYSNNDILYKNFLKEIANSLIKQMRSYIVDLETRTVTISGASTCDNEGKTSYGITRNFLLDGEDMTASY